MQSKRILMDSRHVLRTCRRMAYQLAETIADPKNVILAGINKRGFALAKILQGFIQEATGQSPELVHAETHEGSLNPVMAAAGREIMLIDDVMFSGRTISAAMGCFPDITKAGRIRIAVLVDRGHRRFPFFAAVSGLVYPTKFDEHVHVSLDEPSGDMEVELLAN